MILYRFYGPHNDCGIAVWQEFEGEWKKKYDQHMHYELGLTKKEK